MIAPLKATQELCVLRAMMNKPLAMFIQTSSYMRIDDIKFYECSLCVYIWLVDTIWSLVLFLLYCCGDITCIITPLTPPHWNSLNLKVTTPQQYWSSWITRWHVLSLQNGQGYHEEPVASKVEVLQWTWMPNCCFGGSPIWKNAIDLACSDWSKILPTIMASAGYPC